MQNFLFLVTALSCTLISAAQPPAASSAASQKASDAYTITRMAEKFHVQPRTLDDTLSAAIYDRMLDELDDQHIFFTREDIGRLSRFRYALDAEILTQSTEFLTMLTGIFQKRLNQVDTMIDHITAKPFNYTIREKLTVAEDTGYAADLTGIHTKIYRLLKYAIGYRIAGYAVEKGITPSTKTLDSLESWYRQKAGRSFKRSITRILKSPAGIESTIGTIYCQVIASCYDPHTEYFTTEEKTAFEGALGNKTLGFGLSVTQDADGNPQIGKLKPGGPAFQSGALHTGDKILSIQWDDQPPIDVTGASLAEVGAILSQEGGIKMTMLIKRADGTTQQVPLHKEKLASDPDEDKVKGFVLKGARTVGYISLPAFYEDWEDSKGLNGCANDVAREIIKLKKENIEGLILDLRYNGGGSIQEAVELSGIFIDAGPVAQIKSRDAKPITLKDINRGTIFDGPLILLVNGSSASASEMVAGTLQDYNRALIVGSPTYGKATTQVVLPMDTTLDLDNYHTPSGTVSSYIKMTISRLYRVNGTTAQFSGVRPDIILPEPAASSQGRESDEKFALAPTPIDANKYYTPLSPLPVAALKLAAQKAIDEDPYFTALKTQASTGKTGAARQDLSLYLDDIIRERKRHLAENPSKDSKDQPEKNNLFEVKTDAFETKRIQADHDLQEMDQDRRKNLGVDPYIKISWQLIASMIK